MIYEAMKRHGRNCNVDYQVKEANWKRLCALDSNCMTFWRRQNCGDRKKISGWQGLERREGRLGRAQVICRAQKLLYMTL